MTITFDATLSTVELPFLERAGPLNVLNNAALAVISECPLRAPRSLFHASSSLPIFQVCPAWRCRRAACTSARILRCATSRYRC